MNDLAIKGGKELDAFLKALPQKVERNIMRAALRAGARVIYKEIKLTAPVGPASSENVRLYGGYAGALRDSVRLSVKISKAGKVLASVKVGGKNKKGADVFYAHMVEYGTRPHVITAKKGGALRIGNSFPRSVNHPGARAQPFVRPAFDSKTSEAIAAVTAKIRERLTLQGINVPAPESE